MAIWRKKRMPMTEWAHFQQLFGELQLLYHPGDPAIALFCRTNSEMKQDEIFFTGADRTIVEAFSPGGWSDCDAPSGGQLTLLVGSADSWSYFGIRRCSPLAEDLPSHA